MWQCGDSSSNLFGCAGPWEHTSKAMCMGAFSCITLYISLYIQYSIFFHVHIYICCSVCVPSNIMHEILSNNMICLTLKADASIFQYFSWVPSIAQPSSFFAPCVCRYLDIRILKIFWAREFLDFLTPISHWIVWICLNSYGPMCLLSRPPLNSRIFVFLVPCIQSKYLELSGSKPNEKLKQLNEIKCENRRVVLIKNIFWHVTV